MAGKARLWTPVANAWDVYRRRLLADADAVYEHIWRLIHIHEALVVTLGTILSSRLLDKWNGKLNSEDGLNELRSRLTGLQSDGEALVEGDFCLKGSIEAWVQLLQRFGEPNILPDCAFCTGLGEYLCEGPEGKISFLDVWKRIAPIPAGNDKEGLSRVQRFRAINQLRNKLAHVPLPSRVLSELHKGLRREILTALSPDAFKVTEEELEDFTTKNWHDPLRGIIKGNGFSTNGSEIQKEWDSPNQDTGLRIQPAMANNESWPIEPFFWIDGECKVSLLFRVPDQIDGTNETYKGEYHRFAAEFEPVHTKDIDAKVLDTWIPQHQTTESSAIASNNEEHSQVFESHTDSDTEYTKPKTEDPDILRSVAEEAYRRRDYKGAADVFGTLAQTEDDYVYNHVARLHHGISLWRYGNLNGEPKQIEEAVKVLESAAQHADARYSAQAWYEMSKAYHKLWKLTENGYFDQAYQAAEEAAKRDYQMSYITWIERLDAEKVR